MEAKYDYSIFRETEFEKLKQALKDAQEMDMQEHQNFVPDFDAEIEMPCGISFRPWLQVGRSGSSVIQFDDYDPYYEEGYGCPELCFSARELSGMGYNDFRKKFEIRANSYLNRHIAEGDIPEFYTKLKDTDTRDAFWKIAREEASNEKRDAIREHPESFDDAVQEVMDANENLIPCYKGIYDYRASITREAFDEIKEALRKELEQYPDSLKLHSKMSLDRIGESWYSMYTDADSRKKLEFRPCLVYDASDDWFYISTQALDALQTEYDGHHTELKDWSNLLSAEDMTAFGLRYPVEEFLKMDYGQYLEQTGRSCIALMETLGKDESFRDKYHADLYKINVWKDEGAPVTRMAEEDMPSRYPLFNYENFQEADFKKVQKKLKSYPMKKARLLDDGVALEDFVDSNKSLVVAYQPEDIEISPELVWDKAYDRPCVKMDIRDPYSGSLCDFNEILQMKLVKPVEEFLEMDYAEFQKYAEACTKEVMEDRLYGEDDIKDDIKFELRHERTSRLPSLVSNPKDTLNLLSPEETLESAIRIYLKEARKSENFSLQKARKTAQKILGSTFDKARESDYKIAR